MKIIITGANGMVARATIRRSHEIGDQVVGLTRQDLDIGDGDAVVNAFKKLRPDGVINCAAYTDVDGAESEPEAARNANTLGVGNLAAAASEIGARFVTISTDYVFDGANTGFYTEDDLPNPQGVYAVTKREGEVLAIEANDQAVVVRSGWIYGSGGTNFLSVMHKLLREGKKIKAIGDAYGTPTFADDLAARLRDLVGLEVSGIVHVANTGPGTSYLGFANKLCEIGGFDPGLIEQVSDADLKRPAPRPVSSKLGSVRTEELGLAPVRDWETALAAFMG